MEDKDINAAELARREADRSLVNQYEHAKGFLLKYLRDNGFITASARDMAGTVRELLRFLGVSSVGAFRATREQRSVAFRRSAIGHDDSASLAVMAARG